MKSIFEILDDLPHHDKNQLLEVCQIRHSKQSKVYLLIEELICNPHQTDDYYLNQFYGQKSKSAFSQLKKRVKTEVQELVCQLKLPAGTELSKRISCTEQMLQSQIFLARGWKEQGGKLLEKSLKVALEADLPDLILSIFDTARRFEITGVIHQKELPQLEMIIKSHLQILVNQYSNPLPSPKANQSILSPLLKQLCAERNTWEILTEIRQAIALFDFDLAEKLLNEAEEVLKNDRLSSEVIEEFFLARQQVLLQTGKFKEVIYNFKKLDSTSALRKEVSLELTECQWVALYHERNWEDALRILRKSLIKNDPSNSPKWKYWEAYIHFGQNHFKSALKVLHEIQVDLKKYPDYYLGSKLLEIMILFDQNELDWLDYKMENCRKLITRWKGKFHVRIESAYSLMSQMLKALQKSSLTAIPDSDHFHRLQSLKGAYSWNPTGFELVRYDRWIKSKLED